jgi:hypothetical protein
MDGVVCTTSACRCVCSVQLCFPQFSVAEKKEAISSKKKGGYKGSSLLKSLQDSHPKQKETKQEKPHSQVPTSSLATPLPHGVRGAGLPVAVAASLPAGAGPSRRGGSSPASAAYARRVAGAGEAPLRPGLPTPARLLPAPRRCRQIRAAAVRVPHRLPGPQPQRGRGVVLVERPHPPPRPAFPSRSAVAVAAGGGGAASAAAVPCSCPSSRSAPCPGPGSPSAPSPGSASTGG